MADLARRFAENPLVRPGDVRPSREGLDVQLTLNPGVFRWQGKVYLLMRVAERPKQVEGFVSTIVTDPDAEGGVRILRFRLDDPGLDLTDPRIINYQGTTYLSSISHLRLAWSQDGVHFQVADKPTLVGTGPLESYGVEDARVTEMEGTFYITYTAVSENGIGVGLITTTDWQAFHRHGMILPPTNKDTALFPERVGGMYVAFHRPIGVWLGGPYIWLSRSPDLLHWGDHACLARTIPNSWEEQRLGAGGPPIRTPEGWLEIYHAANFEHRYCLGALLLDLDDPSQVLARSKEPIMEPTAAYERQGFFGEVVFSNGHVVDRDQITVYYGASDEIICGATLSIREILDSLGM